MPVKAGQSEIIQASQKDDEYRSFFRNSLGEFFSDLTGMPYEIVCFYFLWFWELLMITRSAMIVTIVTVEQYYIVLTWCKFVIVIEPSWCNVI